MRIKWYILSFVLSLTVLGVIQQYQEPKANQEVVIQFIDADFSSSQTQESLQAISVTLQDIGAKNISIVSSGKGFFKIAYHSDTAVNKIEKILAGNVEITFDSPSKQTPIEDKAYNFDVFQINKSTKSSWDFEGQEVVIQNLKSDRSFQPKVFKFLFSEGDDKIHFNIKSKCKTNTLFVFVSDNTSHHIPETRAGPRV